MAYIGNEPGSIRQGRRAVYEFTSTANQTAFSGVDANGLTLDLLQSNSNDVFLNGVRLIITDDYTIAGDTLTLVSGAAAGDKLIIGTQDEIANDASYSKAASDSRYINYDGDIVNGTIQMGGSGNNITFADNNKAMFGDDNDLQIYHDSNNSYIDDAGEGSLFLRSGTTYIQNAAGTKTSIVTNAGAGQTLYHNNTPVFVTTATGIDVTGIAIADEINLDGGGDIHSTNDTGYVGIAGGTNSNVGANALFYGGSHSSLAGVTKFRSGSATNITILSDGNVGIGVSDPSQLLHVKKNQDDYTWGRIDNQSSSSSAYSGIQMGAFGNTWGMAVGSAAANSNTLSFVLDAGGANSEKMRIDATGQVGIGVTPTHKLEVAGTTKAEQYLLDAVAKDISDTAVDVFVYDTRKDSDGGAWRKRTQHTSWYNETLNTATRGSRKEFPAVAVIVVEADELIIYDGDDPDLPMWMVFDCADNVDMIRDTSGAGLNAISFTNAIMSVACNGGPTVINFIKETATYYNTSASYNYKGNIEQRNDAANVQQVGSTGVVNVNVNDVAMTVLPNAPIDSATGLPVPTIAVATLAGVSVITDSGAVYDITNASSTYTASYHVSFDTKNNLWFHQGKTDLSYHGWVYVYSMPLSGDTAININSQVASGQNPIALFQRHTGAGGSIQFRTDGGDSLIANTATGNDNGIGVFYLNTGNQYASMAFQSTSDFNTGWQVGDIKLAALSDTDDTNVTGPSVLTNYNLSSGDLTGWTLTSADAGGGIYANQNPVYVATSLVGIGNTGSVRQNITVETGKKYIVGYKCDRRSSSQFRLGIYFGHIGGSILFDDTVANGQTRLYPWTSDYTGTTLLQFRGRGGGDGEFTNFIFDEVEEDRSVNGNGLQVFGTVTKTPVATGADLVAYSGFSNSTNYLFQAYNSDLDFGTGDFNVTLWFNTPDKSVAGTLLHRGSNDIDDTSWATNAVTQIEFNTSNLYALVGTNNFGTNYGPNVPLTSISNNTWHHYVMVRRSGRIYAYLDGNYIDDAANTLTNTNSTGKVYIGERPNASRVFNGSLALYRISATAPSPEQIKKIYNDEKFLFQENAKATLYGTSDAVTALAYDDDTELLHVGTSAGRSVFQGLRRIDNTTDAVGAAISASNGMVAED